MSVNPNISFHIFFSSQWRINWKRRTDRLISPLDWNEDQFNLKNRCVLHIAEHSLKGFLLICFIWWTLNIEHWSFKGKINQLSMCDDLCSHLIEENFVRRKWSNGKDQCLGFHFPQALPIFSPYFLSQFKVRIKTKVFAKRRLNNTEQINGSNLHWSLSFFFKKNSIGFFRVLWFISNSPNNEFSFSWWKIPLEGLLNWTTIRRWTFIWDKKQIDHNEQSEKGRKDISYRTKWNSPWWISLPFDLHSIIEETFSMNYFHLKWQEIDNEHQERNLSIDFLLIFPLFHFHCQWNSSFQRLFDDQCHWFLWKVMQIIQQRKNPSMEKEMRSSSSIFSVSIRWRIIFISPRTNYSFFFHRNSIQCSLILWEIVQYSLIIDQFFFSGKGKNSKSLW